MYVFLGWLNIGLFTVMTAPFWLRVLNTHVLHIKGGGYAQVIRRLRQIHKPLGVLILILALVHGYLALGAFRLHTGSLVWLATAATATLGILFFRLKKKTLFAWHKRMVLAILFFVLLHILFPDALYYILY
ncbi:MAG: hypothetical protein AAGU74_12555 [Bacillota bacterium]